MSCTWKYRDFVKLLNKNGFVLARQKGSHTIFTKGNIHISVPCRNEVNRMLARRLIIEYNLK